MGVRKFGVIAALVVGQLSIVAIGDASPASALDDGSISGTVTSAATNPIADTSITVVDAATLTTVTTVTTDANGDYSLASLPYGDYRAFARVPGNQSTLWFDGGFTEPAIIDPGVITLDATAPIALDVSFDFPTGGFAGTIDGASDGFSPATARFTETTSGYTETASIGGNDDFSVGYIPTGTYELRVDYQGSRTYTFPEPFVTDGNGLSMSVAVPNILEGSVTSPSGPVVGARVDISPSMYMPMPGMTSPITTGIDGGFFAAGLSDGGYRVSVTPPGQSTARYYGGNGDSFSATTITLGSTSPSVTIPAITLPGGGFTGQLTNGATPVAFVTLQFQQSSPMMPGAPMPLFDSTTTDGDGNFTIRYLPAGTYRVQYTDPMTYQSIELASALVTDGTSIATADLAVPSGSITGTVRSGPDPVNGTMSYSQVRLEALNGQFIRSVPVGANGGYTLSNIADGQYYVSFSGMTGTPTYHPSGTNRNLATVVTIGEAGRALTGVDISLPTNRITGTVTAGAAPVGNASVSAISMTNGMTAGSASTDINGDFSINGLADDTFKLRIYTPSGGDVFYGGTDLTSATALTLSATTPLLDVDIALPTGVIEGRLLDNGQPVNGMMGGYQIQLESASTGASRSTSLQMDGSFRFSNVANGTYRLRYSSFTGSSGYHPNGTTLSNATILTIDDTNQLIDGIDIELPDGAISGTVREGADPFVSGGYNQVTLYPAPTGSNTLPGPVRSTQLSMTGTYSFTGVGDGDYVVAFTRTAPYSQTYHPGVASISEATVVTLGDAGRTRAGIDIQLPDGTISGLVTSGPSATPVVGAQVNVMSAPSPGNAGTGSFTTTGADGRFTLTGLADGAYRLSVRPTLNSGEIWYGGTNSSNATVLTLDGADNDIADIEVTLPGGRISGELTGGATPFGWQAFVTSANGSFTTTTNVGPDGRFQFDFVPDGAYRVGYRTNTYQQGYAPGVESAADARIVQISAATPVVDDVMIALPQGAISGAVTIGGQPVASGTFVSVSVERLAPVGSPTAPPGSATSVNTNVDGSYSVGQLFPGRYIVRANGSNNSFPGIPSTGTTFSVYHPGVATRLDATIVEVTESIPTVTNVDIDVPTRSISGIVREAGVGVNGTIRNVEVRLFDRTNDTSRSVRVGPAGTFVFGTLADGDYYLSYSDLDSRATGTYPTGDPDPRFAAPITVDATTPTVASIEIDLPETGSIEGTLTNATPNAMVNLTTVTTGSYVPTPIATVAASNGTFRFDRVVPGEYRVTTTVLDDPGYNGITVYAPGTLDVSEEQTVTVTAGATATTSITVPDPVTVSGRVTGPDGNGVADVAVYRTETQGFYMPTRRLIATTDANGDYTSVEFLPKPTSIEFVPTEASGFVPAHFGGAPLADGAAQLTLASGEQRTGVDGTVGLPGSISGMITGPDGLPADAVVVARSADAQLSYVYAVQQPQTTTVDGVFQLAALPPGEWILDVLSIGPSGQASDGPYARTFSGDTMERDDAAPFVLSSGGAVVQDVQLQAGQTIRGQVTRPDGRPLAGVQVSTAPVFPDPTPWFVTKFAITGADGRYELRGVAPGEVILGHSAAGLFPEFSAVYQPGVSDYNLATPYTVPATGTIPDVDVQLGATVTGTATIVDSDGDPVDPGLLTGINALACPSPQVPLNSYSCSGNNFAGSPRRLADGTTLFVGVPAGDLVVGLVGNAGPSPSTAQISVAPGETFACTLSIRAAGGASCSVSPAAPTGSISGIVIGPDGQPLAGAQVTAHLDDTTAIAGATTDAAGVYQLDVPAGTYRLKASGPHQGLNFAQPSLPEWYDGSGLLYAVGPPPTYAGDYPAATPITVAVTDELTGYDFDLERYVAATANVIGGAPAGQNVSVALCPEPAIPSSAGLPSGFCVDPTTGASVNYPASLAPSGAGYRNDFVVPGTYNLALVRYNNLQGATFEVLSDTVQVTVAGSERLDCELALLGSGDTSTCSVSPYFVAPDTDSDGVPEEEEAGAPNSGDGDNDGVPDAEQANVTSLVEPSIVDPDTGTAPTDGSNYITLASTTPVPATGAPAPLTSVRLDPAPTAPPPAPGAQVQTGLISFTADFRDPVTQELPAVPVTATFVVYLPTQATQYWKYDAATQTWTDATTLAAFDATPTTIGGVERWRVVLTITDGGFGDDDGTINGIVDDPGIFTFSVAPDPLYRARQVGDRVYIERDIAKAASDLGIADFDSDGDGWAVVGRTNGAGDNGPLANFRIDSDGVPFAYVRHHQKGCLELTPRSLDPVRKGQVRLMDQTPDTSGCRVEPPSEDTDGDGIADDEQALYRTESDGRRIYVYRSVAAAEAQLGVSDWNPDGGTEVLYARTNGAGEFGTNEYLTSEDRDGDGVAELPVLWAEHGRKGCQRLEPNRTDTVGVGQTRRMVVVDTLGGACPGP